MICSFEELQGIEWRIFQPFTGECFFEDDIFEDSLAFWIAPPTNQTNFNQWTVGAVYYSALILAEVFGKSNTSRIVDLWGNAGNVYTPSYAIYEEGFLSKVALFNYVDDDSGASDLIVAISIPGAGVPLSVKVK